MDPRGFRFGDWQVDVQGNALSDGDTRTQLEPRVMDVLRYLCRHPGAVIPAEELLQAGWGTVEMGDNPVHKAIAQLRRALGDSSTEPRYIETVRKRGYRAIAEVQEDEPAAGVWQNGSPFRGLEAFQETHAAIFFGRMHAIGRLRELVVAQAAEGCAMALVLGPSGAGKTSLVRAGLLPQLMESDSSPVPGIALSNLLHLDCADIGEGSLSEALGAVLLEAELDGDLLFDGSSAEQLARRLDAAPDEIVARFARAASRRRIGLFVDRLEAIFRAPQADAAQRLAFVTLLERLAHDGGLLLVLACRNDFYPELIELPPLMALKARGGHFDLGPPTGADIAQMVREPARAAQLRFESDPATGASLDDVLCDAARGNPDTLPLLQYCLNELYRQRGEDGTLRFEVFRDLGGIEGALGVRAEQVVSAQSAAQQAALPHVLSLLVNVGEEQGAVTGRRAAWTSLHGDAARELVRAMVESRLLVSELAAGVPSFGVAHEALLRRWPRVAEWIEQHRHALQVRTRLGAQAERWSLAERARDLLLPPGSQVNQAAALLSLDGFALSPLERDYVDVSLRRARFGERIRMAAISAIATLAVLAAVLGLSARRAQLTAEQHRSQAEGLMGFMLGDFLNSLRPLGRLDLLDSVSARAQRYLASTDASDAATRLQRADSLQLIAEIESARGRNNTASEALANAHRLLVELDQGNSKDKALLMLLAANAFEQGSQYLDRREWDAALHWMNQQLTYAQRASAAMPDDPQIWSNVAYAHNSVGGVLQRQGKPEQAVAHQEASLQLRRRVLAQDPQNRKFKGDVANNLSWLAETRKSLGQLDAARALFHEEETLLADVHHAAPEESKWTARLAYSIYHQAELLMQAKDIQAAAARYAEAIGLIDKISHSDPSNKRWKLDALSFRTRAFDTEAPSAAKLSRLQAQLRDGIALSAGKPDADLELRLQAIRRRIQETQSSL
jgi:DNA-binding winged helix-turn-helix (wHTH) protein